jgi:hypothetical protein
MLAWRNLPAGSFHHRNLIIHSWQIAPQFAFAKPTRYHDHARRRMLANAASDSPLGIELAVYLLILRHINQHLPSMDYIYLQLTQIRVRHAHQYEPKRKSTAK